MKKILIIIALMLANIVAQAANNNILTVEDATAELSDATAMVAINLKNTDQITDLQFDLQLPNGFTLNQLSANEPDISIMRDNERDQHSVSSKTQTDGSVRILCTSIYSTAFSGNDGIVLYVKLAKASTIGTGTYNIGLKNIVLSNSTATYTCAPSTATITIQHTARLSFKLDGKLISSTKVAVGSPITPPTVEPRTGYTFSGWGDVPATMPDHDVEYSGAYVINQHQVTYIVDGQTYKTETLDYGTTITPPAAPTKQGYTFGGWTNVPTTLPDSDVTITGAFTINRYKVTYLLDGETYKTDSIAYGANVTLATAPTKTGHTFSGWSTAPTTMPASDVTITGTFTVNRYKVIYLVEGKTYHTDTLDYGTTITPPTFPTKEGYTFSGWGSHPSTVPANDVTITGAFTINRYKVTYLLDGETYKTDSIAYGANVTLTTAPTKTGHTFSGWSTAPTTMPASDVTITGSFTVNRYKVIYLVNGETYHTDTLNYGTTITPPTFPTKEGYTFAGWGSHPSTVPANDVTVTGAFTINRYKVTYLLDGEAYKTDSLAYGANITLATAPTKTGHTFSGWSTAPTTMPASDVTITGSFTVNRYKVTYLVEGKTYHTDTLNYGTTIMPPTFPSKEGYTFSGWGSHPSIVPANDVTITGAFTINRYKVTYLLDGETYKTDSLAYGANVTLATAPTKTGHTFSGWSTAPTTMPASDVTITGSFTVNRYKVIYLVEGKTYHTDTLNYGTTITPPTFPTKEGYTFSGWGSHPSTVPANDVTITGAFTINRYKVTYLLDGETYKTDSLAYGANVTLATAPTKTGHTFSGWSTAPTTMPASDVTITGSFTVNRYKVIYLVEGKTYHTDTLNYGTTITPPTFPTKEGYTFSGWGSHPSIVPANDVTITGAFTVNRYVITYMVDDTIYHRDTLDYSATIEQPTAPEKQGYAFVTWGEVPEQMPASDLTFTAQFEQKAKRGDVNQDGFINAADVVSIYTYIANGADSGVDPKLADVNNDNIINAADVTTVYGIIAGY